jgi:hypothetical protein
MNVKSEIQFSVSAFNFERHRISPTIRTMLALHTFHLFFPHKRNFFESLNLLHSVPYKGTIHASSSPRCRCARSCSNRGTETWRSSLAVRAQARFQDFSKVSEVLITGRPSCWTHNTQMHAFRLWYDYSRPMWALLSSERLPYISLRP